MKRKHIRAIVAICCMLPAFLIQSRGVVAATLIFKDEDANKPENEKTTDKKQGEKF